jgi:hypothetical protein
VILLMLPGAQDAVAAGGGVQLLLAALAAHPLSSQVATRALSALLSVGADDISSGAGSAADVLQRVLTAMGTLCDDAFVQISACKIVCALADASPTTRDAVVAAGGVQLVRRAQQTFRDDFDVQLWAKDALSWLTK